MINLYLTSIVLLLSIPFMNILAMDKATPAIDWPSIEETARQFVEQESPDSVWPFEHSTYQHVKSDKKVFAHFFSPFPLSFDNKATGEDAYSQLHLSPEGSDKYLKGRGGYIVGGGGTLRQRPLPVNQWDSPDWKRINLAIEVLRAERIGLDGFTYDMLGVSPDNEHRRILEMLLEVSERVAPDFKIALMPDMNAELKSKADILVDVLLDLTHYKSLYYVEDGRLLVAPYNAFKQPKEYWKVLIKKMKDAGHPIAFLPVQVGYEHLDKNGVLYQNIIYGLTDWGFRDIDYAEQYDFRNSKQAASPYTDKWMFPVAPQDVRSKSLIAWEAENTRTFRYLWDAAIKGDSQYVQLVTWNDYSEASEISPSSGSQFAYYDLTAYYTTWFKTGTPPAIKEDAIYYTHRAQIFPFPEGVVAEKQRKPFGNAGKTPFINNVEMVALLTEPAVIEIEQNGQEFRANTAAGLATLSVPVQEGRPVFRIIRDQEIVLETESNWEVKLGGAVENPVYHGGSSTRPFTPTPAYGEY
ncbi:endo-1,3-alpha-glucanase family glycosylhydrolase [Coraliomargarita algicola]|uniref:Endo-1,3-alpha-glucanase family glycosylhydrolase n=1 Tax=Coraliomargarita algicola TaxID=3092156 RepID=A0ABZ0RM09_9BACT|nr:endo-1,3-alpha-glucanase family glycosylhydrolase [Coraliomargarita sp. J2-16]WPJ96133.1 endo-1,3-alpha-glucanase family glycosylhydrolase [Coraliomargarita sp. J2-16]